MLKRRIAGVGMPLVAALVAAACIAPILAQESVRDSWQRPEEVMDALDIRAGSFVADVGAGEGYFTFHLAKRVGTTGKVYAEDIRSAPLKELQKRADTEKLAQITIIVGTESDPRLPAGALDAVLIVNAYHEFVEHRAMMAAIFKALKPGGVLGLIDADAAPGEPRQAYASRHVLPEKFEREDAEVAGFEFLNSPAGFENPDRDRKYYFLVFRKPK